MKMKVSVKNIIHHRGDALLDTFEYKAYLALVNGNKKKAKDILFKNHFDQYWTGVRNITTQQYVAEVYKSKGEHLPGKPADHDKKYVKEAVNNRVNYEIETALSIMHTGCKLAPLGKMEGSMVRLFDGHNRAAIQAAMGFEEIDVNVS